MTTHLLVDGRFTCALCCQRFQIIPNIPLTTATAGKRTRPSGNGLNIHTLFKQASNVVSPGATAMTHDWIFRAGRLRFHLMWVVGLIGHILTSRVSNQIKGAGFYLSFEYAQIGSLRIPMNSATQNNTKSATVSNCKTATDSNSEATPPWC